MKKKKKPIFRAKDSNLDAIILNTNKVIRKQMPWVETPKPRSKTKKRSYRKEDQFISG